MKKMISLNLITKPKCDPSSNCEVVFKLNMSGSPFSDPLEVGFVLIDMDLTLFTHGVEGGAKFYAPA